MVFNVYRKIINICTTEDSKSPMLALTRFGLLLCLAVNLFGIGTITMRSPGGGLDQLLRYGIMLFYFFSKYLTVPLFVLSIIILSMKKNIFFKQIISLWKLWFFLIYLAIQAANATNEYAASYMVNVFFVYVMPVLLCLIAFPDKKGILLIRNMFVVVAAVKILGLFLVSNGFFSILKGETLGLTSYEEARLSLENDPITTCTQVCLQALSILLILIWDRSQKKQINILLVALIGILLLLALMTGSRGPIIAFIATFVFLIINSSFKKVIKNGIIVFAIATIIFSFLSDSKMSPLIKKRFISTKEEYIGARRSVYELAFIKKPTLFGNGMGSFSSIGYTEDLFLYPHNTILEMYYEGGIFGLVLFLWLLGSVFILLYKKYMKYRDNATLFCLAGLLFYFMASQFSGYLLANKGIFMFVILGTWLTRSGENQKIAYR